MLVIRLQRTGRRNAPAFRLVVAEKRAAVKGKVKEYLGHYLPARDPHVFEFQRERIGYWVGRGAQPSDTVARLLTQSGMEGLKRFIRTYTKKGKRGEKENDTGKSGGSGLQPGSEDKAHKEQKEHAGETVEEEAEDTVEEEERQE